MKVFHALRPDAASAISLLPPRREAIRDRDFRPALGGLTFALVRGIADIRTGDYLPFEQYIEQQASVSLLSFARGIGRSIDRSANRIFPDEYALRGAAGKRFTVGRFAHAITSFFSRVSEHPR